VTLGINYLDTDGETSAIPSNILITELPLLIIVSYTYRPETILAEVAASKPKVIVPVLELIDVVKNAVAFV